MTTTTAALLQAVVTMETRAAILVMFAVFRAVMTLRSAHTPRADVAVPTVLLTSASGTIRPICAWLVNK